MDEMSKETLLRRFAARVESDCFFIGHSLSKFRTARSLTEAQLAAFLECNASSLPRLAACRKPDGVPPAFRNDVEKIANYCQCSPVRLAALLREVMVLGQVVSGRPDADSNAMLLAARDRLPAKEQAAGAEKPQEEEQS